MTSSVVLDPRMVMRRAIRALTHYAYRYANEEQLHRAIEHVLTSEGINYEHEKTVGADRYDFALDAGVVIEVKMARSRSEAHRQIDQYCQHEHVRAVILVTTRPWLSNAEETEVRGKPVTFLRVRNQSF